MKWLLLLVIKVLLDILSAAISAAIAAAFLSFLFPLVINIIFEGRLLPTDWLINFYTFGFARWFLFCFVARLFIFVFIPSIKEKD
jgi:hypothetical protein